MLHVYGVFTNTIRKKKLILLLLFKPIVFSQVFLSFGLAFLKIQALTPRPSLWLMRQAVRGREKKQKSISMEWNVLAFQVLRKGSQ